MEKNSELTNKTMSGVVWKFLERISAQLVTTIVGIVLARILLPEDYGIVALVTIFITICNVFVSSGFGTALVQKIDSDDKDFSSVFYASIIISIFLYAILFFVAPLISKLYSNPVLTPVLRIMGLRLPIAAINSVQQAYIQKKMQFRKFFVATLVGTVISGALGIYLAYKKYGIWALVVQYLSNVTIDTIILFIVIDWRPKLLFSWQKLKKLLGFGWKILIASLIDTTYNEIRSLIIGAKYSSSELGFFDQGKKYPSILVNNLNSSITSVMLSAMAKVQYDLEKVKNATRKAIQISSYIIMPCMIGLALVAKEFVLVVLTEKWLPMVPYLQIMCFIYALMPMQAANLTAFQALGRSDIFLKLEIIKKAIGFSSILISMWFGVYWIAVSMLIVSIICYFINAFPNKKFINYSIYEQIMDLMPNFISVLFMAVCVFAISFIKIDNIFKLIVEITIGCSSYLFISLLLKNKSFIFIYDYIKKLFRRRKND